uniref:Uncharacterized protein n=1 Tax=Lutzomyia longipalpis TaxID=7200 RepID=A0A1B0CK99_LUTLO
MEPINRDGKIREQVELEDRMRREYKRKWGMLAKKSTNEFYSPGHINREFRERFKKETEIYPYEYTGSGDSFFVSKDMYDNLVKICRCGREKTEGHVLKCLQRVKAKYIEDIQASGSDERNESQKQTTTSNFLRRLPPTSAGNESISIKSVGEERQGMSSLCGSATKTRVRKLQRALERLSGEKLLGCGGDGWRGCLKVGGRSNLFSLSLCVCVCFKPHSPLTWQWWILTQHEDDFKGGMMMRRSAEM